MDRWLAWPLTSDQARRRVLSSWINEERGIHARQGLSPDEWTGQAYLVLLMNFEEPKRLRLVAWLERN